MSRIAALRSTVAELERKYRALGGDDGIRGTDAGAGCCDRSGEAGNVLERPGCGHEILGRTGGGNPNHDDDGKFAASPGGAGHGKHWARRQRRKKRLRRKLRELKVQHKAERQGLAQRQRDRHWKHRERFDRKRASLDKHQAHDLKRMDAEHAREIHGMERRRDRERVQESRQKAGGKVNDEQIAKWEADHARDVESTKESNVKIRKDLQDTHDFDRAILRDERKAWADDIKAEHARQRKGLLRRHRGERDEAIEEHGFRRREESNGRSALSRGGDGYLHPGVMAGGRDIGGSGPGRGTDPLERDDLSPAERSDEGAYGSEDGVGRIYHSGVEAEGVADGLDSFHRGYLDRREPRVGRGAAVAGPPRIGKGRTHKASNAEAILKHCLRRLGLSASYRHDELTGEQAIDLLDAVRDYSRAWLRHECEALIRHYGRVIDDQAIAAAGEGIRTGDAGTIHGGQCGIGGDHDGRGMGGEVRTLSSAMRHHVGYFFDRARSFIRESILAGAMALSGPEGLTPDDLVEADRQHAVQVAYLDQFHRDVEVRGPAELSEPGLMPPPADAMTAPEMAARAEMYGSATWGAAHEINRRGVIRDGKAVRERRFHWREVDHPCGTCAAESGKGWVPVGTLLKIGDSECLGIGCDCYFVYKMPDGTNFITRRGWRRAA